MKPKRIIPIFIAALMTLVAVTATVNAVSNREVRAEISLPVSDASFRDGLFQGKLAVQRGAAKNPATSRWNTEANRAAYAAGYERGYDEPVIVLQ
ncbi:MAG: hypothetical protein WCA00_11780 [Candidatus Acidiferrales bacterium]